ncbi:MAG: ribosome maturation factor RimM [Calditrichaceae bacterium]
MYVIGKFIKPQGIKGELKAEIITSFPERFTGLKKVYINEKESQAYSIESVRLSDRFVFIKLKDINTREEAESLRNEYLYIPDDELKDLDEDEYYIHDLLGIKIYDEQDVLLGELIDVESISSNDIYTMKSVDGREFMIPAIKDVILEVDITKKTMKIRNLEGLLD